MALKLYDTLTREKRDFVPIDPKNVRMYVCGPTVYDFAHIGNARPVIVFDVLFRLLRHLYGPEHVTYVRNITDVDDKINARAAQQYPNLPLNEAIRKVTEKTERQFHEDTDELGCLRPTVEPRATEHINEMRALIDRLIEKQRAYVLEDHILFRVEGLRSYGQLSHRSLDDMRSSERGEVAPKHDPMDFVLWKPSKLGEPAWPSPGGIKTLGRPGWHIECSAMADKWLWEEARPTLSKKGLKAPHRFDIHGGGVDLLFPHHENERAQSCRAFGKFKMAQYWMHNGFLQVEGEKMAKSAGNFVTIRELLEGWKGRAWPGPTIRLAMLKTHYRQPIDWTADRLVEAYTEIGVLKNTVRMANPDKGEVLPDVISALSDDLNTHLALQTLMQRANKPDDLAKTLVLLGLMKDADFAIGRAETADQRKAVEKALENNALASVGLDRSTLDSMIAARNAARKAKDFEESDRIRDELAKMGIVLKDTKDGTTWEIAR